ncbi:MAG: ornithine carbamoyltransferase [Candidatus Saganbacteria bacterium]|nr:ornithine carbamoyltransferase [Candidatus Saganbacteria bacterium]
MKDLVSIHDLSKQDVLDILDLTTQIKSEPLNSERLKGKALALIFEKPSNRTRVSFEVGMFQLGGHAVSLSAEVAKREEIKDVGRTLSRYVDGIMFRTFQHEKVVGLAEGASVPVINGLSDLLHPCQALGDVFTIKEKKGLSNNLKVAYIGDGNNVCHSLMLACAKVGLNLTIATPKQYKPSSEILHQAMTDSSGAEITLLHDPVIAAKDADVIYTDVWTSMGQEKENKKRKKIFKKFQINQELVKLAKPDVIIMHCLPAHRGDEITDEVMDSNNSVVFDQAENRLHVQKAVLCLLLGGKE